MWGQAYVPALRTGNHIGLPLQIFAKLNHYRSNNAMADYIKEHYNFPLSQKSENKPLQGVRVIDAGNMVAAPFATVLLAAFGADGIKIEHPKYGDGQRKLEPIMDGI